MIPSGILTLTRVPEAKFSRFSRPTFVKATKTDERYNAVSASSLNNSSKTLLWLPKQYQQLSKPAKGSVKCGQRKLPEHRHFSDVLKSFDNTEYRSSRQGIAYLERGSRRHKGFIVEDFDDSNDILSQILSDLQKEKSNGSKILIHRIDVLESDSDYEVEKRRDEDTFKGFRSTRKQSDVDRNISKERTNFSFPVFDQKGQCNLVRFPKHERPSICSKEDSFEDQKQNIDEYFTIGNKEPQDVKLESGFTTIVPDDTLQNKQMNRRGRQGSSRGKGKPKLISNRCYAGDIKVLAYRPTTSLDTFRRNHLDANVENPVPELNVEEGQQIWKHIDLLLRNDNKINWTNSGVKQQNKHSYRFDNVDRAANCLEFLPRFQKQFEQSTNTTLSNVNKTHIGKSEMVMERERTKQFVPRSTDINSIKIGTMGESQEKTVNEKYNHIGTFNRGTVGNMNKSNKCGEIPDKGACMTKGSTMTTTTLPRITPASTPLPTGITQPPPRSHSSASMYVPYPPKELSSSVDFIRIPGRINPLAPPPPRRRINWSWETTDQHFENEKRSLLMQKREHTRYHSAWSKAFYGAPAEKEAYRRHTREMLKQQMSDRKAMDKQEFQDKIQETEQAIKYDQQCREHDAREYHRKHTYLMQYRDGNKKQMENNWMDTKYNRELENRIDRERLRYNPINWSCTLK